MSNDIITIHIGHTGSMLGCAFWDQLHAEHGIDVDTGKRKSDFQIPEHEKVNTYFEEYADGTVQPRSLFLDVNFNSMDKVRCSAIGKRCDSNFIVHGYHDDLKHFAKGFCKDGQDFVDYSSNTLRKLIEKSDHVQAIQLMHGFGGGTGSGMTARLAQKLKQDAPKQTIISCSVFPCEQLSVNREFFAYNTIMGYVVE